MTKIIFLTKDKPLSWALMPGALERIRAFCAQYDTDSSGQQLCDAVTAHFATPNPMVLVVVALRGTGIPGERKKMIGHLLASIDTYHDKKFATILQYQLDERVDTSILKATLDRLGTWAGSHGAEQFQVLAQSRSLAKAFEKFYGFSEHRVLLRRKI